MAKRRPAKKRTRLVIVGLTIAVVALDGCARVQALARPLGIRPHPHTPPPATPPGALPDPNDPFLVDLEQRSFEYFWRTTDAKTGLTPDRSPSPSFSSIAAIGFALTAYPIGASEGYVSRAQAAARTIETLKYLYNAPEGPGERGTVGYKGFFYHFLDIQSGRRFGDVELSTMDTSLLLAGVLFCQSYFDGASPQEEQIRAYADSIYRRVDWTWFAPNAPALALAWTPDSGYVPYDWRGYNEGMVMYVLALGSPTHPLAPEAWGEYTRTYRWEEYFGTEYLSFGPAFGHQYSQIWVDFRGIQDAYMRARGIDYFENSRRAVYAQHAYAMLNPMGWRGYGTDLWGLTACDGPRDTSYDVDGTWRVFRSYWARGAAYTRLADDGTVAPTALGGSLPFAPELVVTALKAMRDAYGDRVYSTYGFVDAFNPSYVGAGPTSFGHVEGQRGWFDTDYLGIDEGPIVSMIENYRTGLVWNTMKKNPYIVRGLRRAGFSGGWLDQAPPTQ